MGILYSRVKRKLVQGIGVNDADYPIYSTTNGNVPAALNTLFIDSGANRGEFPIGVSWEKKASKFRAYISINGKYTHLGLFTSADRAQAAWLEAKLEIAQELLETETNPRVRYAIQCGIEKMRSKYGYVLSQ